MSLTRHDRMYLFQFRFLHLPARSTRLHDYRKVRGVERESGVDKNVLLLTHIMNTYTFRRKHYPKEKKLTAILITLFMTVVRSFHRVRFESSAAKSTLLFEHWTLEIFWIVAWIPDSLPGSNNWRHAWKNSLNAETLFLLKIGPGCPSS